MSTKPNTVLNYDTTLTSAFTAALTIAEAAFTAALNAAHASIDDSAFTADVAALNSAYTNYTTTLAAYTAAADTVYFAANINLWPIIKQDIEFLESHHGQPTQAEAALLAEPLWHGAAPGSIMRIWDEAQQNLDNETEPWDFWFEFIQLRLGSYTIGWAINETAEAGFLGYLIEQEDEWWDRDVNIVNRDIRN